MKKVIFVIGVSGCGKSTIGSLLAKEFDIPFLWEVVFIHK